MRWGGKKTKVALVVLLLAAAGYAAFRVVQHYRGRQHYEAAQEALERRDFRQAGSHLEMCLAVWPRDPAVRLLAARTARRGGDADAAQRHLRVYKELQGPEGERLREVQLLLVQQGDVAEADKLVEVCTGNPDAPDAYLILEAVLEAKVARLTQAHDSGMSLVEGPAAWERARTERLLDLWSQKRPGRADQVQGWVWRGQLHLLSDLLAAAADFRSALDLNPDHFDARLYLAESLTDYDPQEAVRHLELLRQRDPRNSQVCILLASFRRGLGQLAEAQQALDEVLAFEPDHVAALLERGRVGLDAGHPEEAAAFLRRALDRAPNDPFIHLALSQCLYRTGHEEEAKQHQRRYSEIESQRAAVERVRAEEERAAWRNRVGQ